jgi:dipeptidyl aminopeptidase/acylaminoacyl peptidase
MTAKTTNFLEISTRGNEIYWIEVRPLEGGRYVIVRRAADGSISDCTPPGFNARTTVHEYGGGIFTVADGVIYFSNFKDRHLYRQPLGQMPEVLTPGDGYVYADLVVDAPRQRLICIREDHTGPGEAVNTIVSLSLAGGDNGQVLVQGNNFYSSPRLSPDGAKLAWLTWNHPNMPWDGTELWVAEVNPDGTLGQREQVAGGVAESIFQPEWSPEGVLHFISDRSNWWNLYRLTNGQPEPLYPLEAEFGEPQWVFGMSTYAFISSSEILCAYTRDGVYSLAKLDTISKTLTPIETPFTDLSGIHAGAGFGVFIGGSPKSPYTVTRLDLVSGQIEPVKPAFEVTLEPGYFSIPQSITFPTTGGNSAYGIYYPPQNRDFSAPEGEKPPLMVLSHGGPTGSSGSTLRYGIQYWTSRGFAVLDVNYGGSTGYGRAYRQWLNGQWGIVDVDDCCNGALYLVAQGLVDGKRLAIRGGSAGGFTTLAALAFKQVFSAGASHFGVSDLEALAQDTHKFESRYLDNLVGPYPARQDVYYARSPIHFADQIACPLILFQGDEDQVVPPSQSQKMFEALRDKELPVAYVLFAGEQHGFRKAENIKRALEGELYFYSKIFGFGLADPIEPVQIENL